MNIVMARTFIEVVEAGNLNRAAERLNVTQSTVTTRLNALEDQLRQKLIIRSRAGTELTAAGFKFLRYAEILVQVWHQAQQEVALPKGFSDTFVIGYEVDLWDGAVEKWLIWLRSNLPDVALAFWTGDKSALNKWLSSGLINIALFHGTNPINAPSSAEIFRDRLVLVSKEKRELERWNTSYVFVDWGEDFRRTHALSYPVNETPALTFGEGSIALRHILTHGGSGYFPLRAVKKHLEQETLHIVPKAPEFSIPVHFQRSTMSNINEWQQEAIDSLQLIGQSSNPSS